ncbi:MAG: RnfH family protein [Gammaproteobacteria bacterium]|nr:RnfH family protein [Gammaproteobacteria bacterium]
MENDKTFKVEVAYARPTDQRIIQVEVTPGSTLETAIDRSGILEIYPEIDLNQQKVGVFGELKKLTDHVNEGDRIEIYRPLTIDPMEARRNKANAVKKSQLVQGRIKGPANKKRSP